VAGQRPSRPSVRERLTARAPAQLREVVQPAVPQLRAAVLRRQAAAVCRAVPADRVHPERQVRAGHQAVAHRPAYRAGDPVRQKAVSAVCLARPAGAVARKVVRSTAAAKQAAQPVAVERRVAAAEPRVAAERPAAAVAQPGAPLAVAAASPGARLAVAAARPVLLPAAAAEQRGEPRAAVAGLGAQRAAAVLRALLPEAAEELRALQPAAAPFSSLPLRPSSSVLRSAPASAAPVRTSAPYLAGGSARPRTAHPAWRPGWRPWWPREPPLWRCKQAGAILRNS
jgi:hypothetical protein